MSRAIKILFAINHTAAEKRIKELLPLEYEVVGVVDNKDSVLDFLASKPADVMVFRENMEGKEEGNDCKYILSIRQRYPNLRVIFLADDRVAGDPDLAKLITFKIYDIMVGTEFGVSDIVNFIINPQDFSDVKNFLPYHVEDSDVFNYDEMNNVNGPSSQTESVNNEASPKKILSLAERLLEKKKESTEPKTVIKTINVPVNDAATLKKIQQLEAEKEKIAKEKQAAIEKARRLEEEAAAAKTEALEREAQYKREIAEMNKNNASNMMQRIVVFHGVVPGVGTTTTALNSAAILALGGHKVCFVELDESFPVTSCWLSFEDLTEGLEQCFLGIESRNFQKIHNNIITKDKILKNKGSKELHDFQEQLPDNLSYISYSRHYLYSMEHTNLSPATLKELLLILLYKEGFEYVVLDVGSYNDFSLLETVSMFSASNVFVMSQDISTVIKTRDRLRTLAASGLDFEFYEETDNIQEEKEAKNYKNFYVINKFDARRKMNIKMINEWFVGCKDKIYFIPENGSDILNATFSACIPIQKTKNREYVGEAKRLAYIV